MTDFYLDTETFSGTPIACGTHRYMEDALFEVMIVTYAEEDGEVELWDVTDGSPMPKALARHLHDPSVTLVAHGVGFDRPALRHGLNIDKPLERWECTQAMARAHGLPGGLDKLSELFRLPSDTAKDKRGRQLIQLFCKPGRKGARNTRLTHPKEWEEFKEYAKSDIRAMRALRAKMPRWNATAREIALWRLDQQINDRGFAVDMELVHSAIQACEQTKALLDQECHELTDGEVASANKRDKLLAHLLVEYGVSLPDMTVSTLERRLEDENLPEVVKELIRVRLETSLASLAKYKALARSVSADDRLRGTLAYCGAARTGRWAGRIFQPQNLARPSHPHGAIEDAIDNVKTGVLSLVETPGDVRRLLSSALRGTIVAPPGRKLVVTDLANIEGRVLAWLAGEEWKLRAFHEFDHLKLESGGWLTPEELHRRSLNREEIALARDRKGDVIHMGHDLYVLSYARAFGVTPEEVLDNKKDGDGMMRMIGKVMELALGYQGAVGAFGAMAKGYGVDLPDRRVREIVANWRAAHPAIVAFWRDLEHACVAAVVTGRYSTVGLLEVSKRGAYLRIRLPSGRYLLYAAPRVEDGKLTYMGVNPYTKRWERLKTYGGKLAENVTQAGARDALANGMFLAEEHEYRIVLTVHDELLTEAADTPEFSVGHLSALLSTPPNWAIGLPLAAAGFEATRYRKD